MMPASLLSDSMARNEPAPAQHEHARLRTLPHPGAGAWFGLLVIVLLTSVAVAGPWVAGDPDKQVLRDRLLPPVFFGGSWQHPLGTDQLGRDQLARVIAGCRVTLLLSLVVSLASLVIGTSLGLIGGLRPGRVDRGISFLVDVQIALPVVVVAIAASALFAPGFLLVFLVLLSTGWVAYQRVVRMQTRSLSQTQFVEASRAIGANQRWIMRRHLLPNLRGTVAVLATQQMAAVILFEAASELPRTGYAGGCDHLGTHGFRWPRNPSQCLVGFGRAGGVYRDCRTWIQSHWRVVWNTSVAGAVVTSERNILCRSSGCAL